MSQGSSYTAPQNGYLDIQCIKNDDGAASELIVTINGSQIFRYYAKSSDQVYAPCIIPLSAGDVVVFDRMNNMYRVNIDMISFIPVE